MAGIDASMMTSDGTFKLVMPLSEFTIATPGPSAYDWAIAASATERSSAERLSRAARMLPKPSFGSPPAASSSDSNCENRGAKNVRTA